MQLTAATCALALLAVLGTGPALAQGPAQTAATQPIRSGTLIPTERYQLANGLNVVFHIDRSDPVVAVVLAAHVGSAREEPGRTGFAHMFEHLFFLDSENLGPGGLDRLSARIGGSGANGSTSRDLTDYLQTVPNDGLEKMIWAEADKLGFFINTVTEAVLEKEKEVVKNEKRQGVDNQPYGHTGAVIYEALYPKGHPYSWSVIGSLADLDAATLADVRNFYARWYTPDNATLVLAGDFDPAQARLWVEKYFGEIKRGSGVPKPTRRPAVLTETVRLMHEDNFAQLPELTLTFPMVERNHPDEAALDVLMALLTDGKEAPLNEVLIDEKKLTSSVGGYASAAQIAGEGGFQVRAFADVDLDTVKAALQEGLRRFETKGVDPEALARIKTQAETSFFAQLDSVLGKGAALARYSAFGGSPDADLAAIQAVTADDVMRVYKTYIAGKPHVATSFVPKGKPELALAGSKVANVVEEAIVQGAEKPVDPKAETARAAKTPSAIDRRVEPPAGPAPQIKAPSIWAQTQLNGLKVSGIQNTEIPLATFQISIDGGRLFEDPKRPGAANLLASILDRGTARRTPAELENALKALGASIQISAGDERFVISGRTLDRNLAATMDLVTEIITEPRWDATELELARNATLAEIRDQKARPAALASLVMDKVTYGSNHILGTNALGTEASVGAFTMEDLKALHQKAFAPNLAHLYLVSPRDLSGAGAALGKLGSAWSRRDVQVPSFAAPSAPTQSRLYFYDVPDAKQSVLLFGYPGPKRADPDYFPATVMNYRLGGGGFASRLTQELREGKGYTYGIRSGFDADSRFGLFSVSSPVRANVTLEAAALVKSIMSEYGATFTAEDLEVTRSALSKSRARAFETAGAKIRVLQTVGEYGLPPSYLDEEAKVIDGMTVDRVKDLATRYIRPNAMTYVVVGDAKTQAERLEALGFGKPIPANGLLDDAK